jgi:hypothetical protein
MPAQTCPQTSDRCTRDPRATFNLQRNIFVYTKDPNTTTINTQFIRFLLGEVWQDRW